MPPFWYTESPGFESSLFHYTCYLPSRHITKRVWQDFSITEDAWNGRSKLIRAEHRAETARIELELSWKQPLISKGGGAAAAPAADAAVVVADEQLPYEDDDAQQ